ncbi:bifunctional methylenetetrahydrofolate dehydrogenase/methenyltetrahydrofolate cyclohydrolase FolD [Fundidesulfovibrio agrisoli]|uniref:bifunctional methylenetetrahydrofolate dehydrogenase/methenyltetrahydrofolate cyclohydrolase FolD n=1 Tax=Fundidesulfovibrio agrisoli TaxID=2922717 RepID=UPI001FAE4973|nr:bifunctional methylenetetrahydrofolate dehydrogenase/methenyltetrahydrofolate cyclohydrolase FolD [Fundidesulfovibrio agrisoli]
MQLLDGKATALSIRQQLAQEVAGLAAKHGRPPHLAVVLVGEDPASQVYVRNKEKACADAGIRSSTHRISAQTTQAELETLVSGLNADDGVDGILVQAPLPKHLDILAVQALVAPEKDVDGFHPMNVGKLCIGLPCLEPCTPAGVMVLLERYGISCAGKRAVVIGRSNIVGKPMALMLARSTPLANATVTICHSRTPDLPGVCREADILVAAIGRARFVTREMVKPGAVVIDVGMNRTDTGLCGDVDFEAVKEVASAITPAPGGIGPMTIAMLISNTVKAFTMRKGA